MENRVGVGGSDLQGIVEVCLVSPDGCLGEIAPQVHSGDLALIDGHSLAILLFTTEGPWLMGLPGLCDSPPFLSLRPCFFPFLA